MATVNTVGGPPLSLAIAFLDQNGQPMATTPKPDSPPAWSNTTPASETLAASADGLTCTDTAVAAGTDTVNLSVVVGGKTFSASLNVTVSPAPQVLTSVEIVPAP